MLATPPGFRYITAARNIFADSPLVFAGAVGIGVVLAVAVPRAAARER